MIEIYVCYNCGNYAPLNHHLRCQYCNSDAVTPAETGQRVLQVRQQSETMADWAIRFVDAYLPRTQDSN